MEGEWQRIFSTSWTSTTICQGKNISQRKHMQGMKQRFELGRPKKTPAQQLLYQRTVEQVELPLALKLRCVTCVQYFF
jgi:hypothetical protein